jgi:hypothetical protein
MENTVERGRPQMTVWRMRIACCITKATNTHSKYEILMLFHCDSGYNNARHCYVVGTLSVL